MRAGGARSPGSPEPWWPGRRLPYSSELGLGHVLEELLDGGIHHVAEGLGIEAHAEHRDREEHEGPELAAANVRKLRDMVVADRAIHHALHHPERVGGAEDECRCREEGEPEVHLDG